jgi:hypothetical protein
MGITRHHSLGWVRRAARDGPGHESEFHHGQSPGIDQPLGIVGTRMHRFRLNAISVTLVSRVPFLLSSAQQS